MTTEAAIDALIAAEGLPPGYAVHVRGPLARLAGDVAAAQARLGGCLVAGLCGPQGSGKSTTAAFLKLLLEAEGRRVAALSLDDLYLTREERADLAQHIHPLLAVRGVPGTHDVALGAAVLDALSAAGAGDEVVLPRFDKAVDTRAARSDEHVFRGPADIVIFEGWCVGARPQAASDLASPINPLEAGEDPDGAWRRYVNDQLAGPYQALFARIGFLALLEAPGFASVLGWRVEQEAKLRAQARATSTPLRVMSEGEVARFVMHYERLTRHVLAEMPDRCDVRLRLDGARRIVEYVVST